jgi:hypothetical protein
MAQYNEVAHKRLYLREPNTERLRKNAAGRLRHMLATGWRETERWYGDRYITVRMERSGVDPAIGKLPAIPPPPPRSSRRDSNRFGGGGPRN